MRIKLLQRFEWFSGALVVTVAVWILYNWFYLLTTSSFEPRELLLIYFTVLHSLPVVIALVLSLKPHAFIRGLVISALLPLLTTESLLLRTVDNIFFTGFLMKLSGLYDNLFLVSLFLVLIFFYHELNNQLTDLMRDKTMKKESISAISKTYNSVFILICLAILGFIRIAMWFS